MTYSVVLECVATGEQRVCPQSPLVWTDADFGWWDVGNMSCDCNRELEFRRAGGDSSIDVQCSDGRFRAVRFILADGTELDGPDAPASPRS